MRRVPLATGVTLAVAEHGVGTPVLLLHAWGETHRTFDRLVPMLTDLRLVVPDQRGVGESDKPPEGYALADAAADAAALLDGLDVDAAWVVGTSSGGYVAQQLAADRPDRVRGLVLVGSPSDLRRADPSRLLAVLDSFSDPVSRADVEALHGAIPVHRALPAAFLDDQLEAALSIPKHVWLAGFRGLVEATPPVTVGIRTPTLLLWGERDDLLGREQADGLLAAVADSRLVTYEDTGHLVLWEQPERVARDVRAFVDAV